MASITSTAGNDLIQGLGGNDYIDAWRGGDERIEGGSGQDLINGGAGNDVLLGGTDSDAMMAGEGNDRLYGETEYTFDAAYTLGETQSASGQRGDLLDGGSGDDTTYARDYSFYTANWTPASAMPTSSMAARGTMGHGRRRRNARP